MTASEQILAAMVAEGDTPATALERIRQEDGPDEAPIVGWDRALYRPERLSLRERLWARLSVWWSYRPKSEPEWPVRTEADRAHLRAFLECADAEDAARRAEA